MSTKEIGTAAETQAVQALLADGFSVVERNFRCRAGELDIVARDPRGVLVFVEVRSRRSAAFGDATCAIPLAKQRQVARVAAVYLAVRRPDAAEIRFDVIAVTGGDLVHLEDAFRA
ncbi:MAG TPA: YraN family protein [Kofleriaceae bacterium]